MTLKEELLKTLLDKGVLGLLLLGCGFYLNRLLERFRTSLSFSTELNRTRVTRIGDVWEKLYEFEQCAELSNRPGAERGKKSFAGLFDELHDLIQHNRFWIGDSAYNEINAYKRLLRDLTNAREAGEERKIADLQKEVDATGRTVTDVRDRLLKGGW